MARMIEKTAFYSLKSGSLPEGCRLCVQGRKLVMFVTGICPRRCFYCPLADTKKGKDVVFANEWLLANENDLKAILEEAELTEAEGAGITGGDPLSRMSRTLRYIKLLKKRFGKKFHIHLYTLPESVTEKKLRMLHNAGLDEIRLHPDLFSRKHWDKIGLIRKFRWDVGIEIPAIPGTKKQAIVLLDYFKDKIDFLNINELEISDTNADELVKRGFVPKDRISYGVKGSSQLAKFLLKRYAGKIKQIHYCTTTLKDRVQLANRIKIRAKNAAKPFDIITDEGMLVRGALYLKELVPGFGYRKKIEKMNSAKRKRLIKKLDGLMKNLARDYRIKEGYLAVDAKKLRLLTAPAIAGLIKQKDLKPAIVTEYPTWDQTEVEVEFIS